MAGDERDVQILSKAFEKEKRCQTKEEEPRTGVWGEAVSIRDDGLEIAALPSEYHHKLYCSNLKMMQRSKKIKEPDYYR